MRLYYYKYVIIIINVINNIEYILIEEGKEIRGHINYVIRRKEKI